MFSYSIRKVHMAYRHLTQEERYQIYAFLSIKKSFAQIAKKLKRVPSTISREVKRNKGKRSYRPIQSQSFAKERSKNSANGPRVSTFVWDAAKLCLKKQWSPEQISGRFKKEKIGNISHETIYQKTYQDKREGGTLYKNLRCQKKRRKRYASGENKRGQIVGRVSISERPKEVDEKLQLGHWEGDTIIGAGHKQAIVSVVERKTQFTLLQKVEKKTSDNVSLALIDMMLPLKKACLTITFDNGKEFAGHADVTKNIETKVYFADPYSSWQRGLNEQVNGLVRQYFPKKKKFSTINPQEVEYVAYRLNSRPRKLLNFMTPFEAFFELFNQPSVALRV